MTSRSSTDLLPAALSYAKRGWPVFPLWPGNKTPLTKDGFKSASVLRDVVLAWWHQWPDANIGLATGTAFDVLDIDGPEGKRSLHDFLMRRGEGFYRHPGPVSVTGRGLHLLFAPTGKGNAAGLLPKLDYRGNGGYIVAPPSLHPLGHRYAWDPTRGPETPLPQAPDWLTALFEERGTHREAAPKATEIVKATPGIEAVRTTTAGHIALQRPDIIEVAEALGLYLLHKGSYTFARCPFHHGLSTARVHAGTPSMMLDTDKNNFYCHSCHAAGDSFDLQQHRDMNGTTF